MITFILGCDATLTDPTGVIESPNFPELYPDDRSCTWLIDVGEGYSVKANFTHFDLEHSSTCGWDYLEV